MPAPPKHRKGPGRPSRAAAAASPGLADAITEALEARVQISHALARKLATMRWDAAAGERVVAALRDHPKPLSKRAAQLFVALTIGQPKMALALASELGRTRARLASTQLYDDGLRLIRFDSPDKQAIDRVLRRLQQVGDGPATMTVLPAAPAGQFRHWKVSVRSRDTVLPAWREFLLEEDATWGQLGEAIVDASGDWDGSHAWGLWVGESGTILATSADEDDSVGGWDGLIAEFVLAGVRKFSYRYDFGDSWRVDVVVAPKPVLLPECWSQRLLGGENAFPAEDSRGVGGPKGLTERWQARRAGRKVPRDEWMEEWSFWQPDAFDVAAVRKRFDHRR